MGALGGGFHPRHAGVGNDALAVEGRDSLGRLELDQPLLRPDTVVSSAQFRSRSIPTRSSPTTRGKIAPEAALANYQTGKVPFIAVLEALTTLYNDRATHLRLLANHEQTLASLEAWSSSRTPSRRCRRPP
jgi:hypothetical protein